MEKTNDGNNCDGFKEFEKNWSKKLEEKITFENLSREDLRSRIDEVERKCFILELKNEILYKYLSRHNPSTIRDLNNFMLKYNLENKPEKKIEKIFCGVIRTLKKGSHEALGGSFQDQQIEKAVLCHLIEIVNQEIADICMNSKIRKTNHNKAVLLLTCDLEASKSQASYLNEVLSIICDRQTESGKTRQFEAKLLSCMKLVEELSKKTATDLRKVSIELHRSKKEYSKYYKDCYQDDSHFTLADLKLLKINVEKLNKKIEEDRKVLMDLACSYSEHFLKAVNEQHKSKELKDNIVESKIALRRLEERLIFIQNYRVMLEKQMKILETKEHEIEDSLRRSNIVMTPKEYIERKCLFTDRLKKLKSRQRMSRVAPESS